MTDFAKLARETVTHPMTVKLALGDAETIEGFNARLEAAHALEDMEFLLWAAPSGSELEQRASKKLATAYNELINEASSFEKALDVWIGDVTSDCEGVGEVLYQMLKTVLGRVTTKEQARRVCAFAFEEGDDRIVTMATAKLLEFEVTKAELLELYHNGRLTKENRGALICKLATFY